MINRTPTNHLIWVLIAGILGFATSAIFAGLLRLPRNWFLVPYAILITLFLYSYFHRGKIDLRQETRRRWLWGMIGALVVSAFMISNIVSQAAYPHPRGLKLLFSIVWPGIVYGALDALLLSVMPILATRQAFSELRLTNTWYHRLLIAGVALVASLLVTVAYHFGYPEFRNGEIVAPIIGNGIISLSFLVTRNPIAPVGSHIVMHVAAVLHGMETASQLPPHY